MSVGSLVVEWDLLFKGLPGERDRDVVVGIEKLNTYPKGVFEQVDVYEEWVKRGGEEGSGSV
jgi:hypothetical protein